MPIRSWTTLLVLGAVAASAAAAPLTLDRTAVLDLARAQATEILAARARVGVAEGEAMASRAWRSNPEIQYAHIPRSNEFDSWNENVIVVSQALDLGFNGRGARIDAAEAGARASGDLLRGTEVAVLADVARAYLVALHARDLMTIAADLVALTARLDDMADRRYEAGEVGALDTQVATVTLAGARVAMLRAETQFDDAAAELVRLLALDADTDVELIGEVSWPPPPDLATVRTAAQYHPDLAALTARTEQSGHLRREAGAAGRPQFAISAGAGREDETDILEFGVSMSLPVLNTGKGERRAAAAADTLAYLQLAEAQRRITSQVTSAWRRHHKLQTAVHTYLDEALSAHTASVALAEESYRTGKSDLGEVLTVQSGLLDVRVELTNLRLDAALAALEVHALAALPPLTAPEGETTP